MHEFSGALLPPIFSPTCAPPKPACYKYAYLLHRNDKRCIWASSAYVNFDFRNIHQNTHLHMIPNCWSLVSFLFPKISLKIKYIRDSGSVHRKLKTPTFPLWCPGTLGWFWCPGTMCCFLCPSSELDLMSRPTTLDLKSRPPPQAGRHYAWSSYHGQSVQCS